MPRTFADLYESWLTWLTLTLLAWSLRSLFELIAWFTTGQTQATLLTAADTASVISGVLLLVASLFVLLGQTRLLWSIKSPKELRLRRQLRPDNYTFEAIRQAAMLSWFSTFAIVMFLEMTSNRIDFAPEPMLDLVAFLLGGVFSISFLIMTLRNDAES